MTFRETLKQAVDHGGMNKIAACIHTTYYKDGTYTFAQVIKSFSNVVKELLSLEETVTSQHYSIYLVEEVDDSDPDEKEAYINVLMYNEDTDERFALDFEDWGNIIDMNIHSTKKLDVHSLLCHILWEITFWGMSNNSIKQAGADLLKQADDIDVSEFKLPKDNK